MSIASAASELGFNKSTLTKACRARGILVWPYLRHIGKMKKPRQQPKRSFNLIVDGNPNASYSSSSEVLTFPDQSLNSQIEDNGFGYFPSDHRNFELIDIPTKNYFEMDDMDNLIVDDNFCLGLY